MDGSGNAADRLLDSFNVKLACLGCRIL